MPISADVIAAIISSLIGATYLNILWEIRKLRIETHKNSNRMLLLANQIEQLRIHVEMPPFEIPVIAAYEP